MYITLLRIDKDGYLLFDEDMIVEEGFANGDLLDYVETPLPTDEEGNQLSFYKPKWTGSEWIEGATQEEIDELTKVEPSPPTEIEIMEQRLADLELMLTEILTL